MMLCRHAYTFSSVLADVRVRRPQPVLGLVAVDVGAELHPVHSIEAKDAHVAAVVVRVVEVRRGGREGGAVGAQREGVAESTLLHSLPHRRAAICRSRWA